jgi:hypothetical protein
LIISGISYSNGKLTQELIQKALKLPIRDEGSVKKCHLWTAAVAQACPSSSPTLQIWDLPKLASTMSQFPAKHITLPTSSVFLIESAMIQ